MTDWLAGWLAEYDGMADGRQNKSSAQMTNSSQILAESLTNLVESRSENVIEFLDGNYCEIQKYIEELTSEILKLSTAAIQVKYLEIHWASFIVEETT